VKPRLLIAIVAGLLAVTGLTACRTNVGTAATVSGQQISESAVGDYITPTGPASSVVANAKTQGQTVSPRSEVLHYLILEKVFEQTLQHNGGVPSAGQLASYHDQAASLLLQTSLTGSDLDRQLRTGLTSSGVAEKFAPVFLRVEELEYALISRQHLSQLSELVALVKKAGVTVSVNPRYGQWSTDQLGLVGGVPTPAYLSVQPSAPAG
jgi:hypothetical protein